MMRLLLLLARASAGALCLALIGSCSESGPRIYTARLYRSGAGCLEPFTALGLVQSRELGAECDPVCLRLDGGLFVSPVCPPYPARASVEAPDGAECVAAREAFSRGAPCDSPPGDAAGADAASGLVTSDAPAAGE